MPLPQHPHAQSETTRARKGNTLTRGTPRRAWAFLRQRFSLFVLPLLLGAAGGITLAINHIRWGGFQP